MGLPFRDKLRPVSNPGHPGVVSDRMEGRGERGEGEAQLGGIICRALTAPPWLLSTFHQCSMICSVDPGKAVFWTRGYGLSPGNLGLHSSTT